MSRAGFLLILASAGSTVMANLAFRKAVLQAAPSSSAARSLAALLASLLPQPLFIAGLVAYAVAAALWLRALATEQVTTGYPLLVSMTFVLVTVGAVLLLRESVSWQKGLGLCFILAGIALIARAP